MTVNIKQINEKLITAKYKYKEKINQIENIINELQEFKELFTPEYNKELLDLGIDTSFISSLDTDKFKEDTQYRNSFIIKYKSLVEILMEELEDIERNGI